MVPLDLNWLVATESSGLSRELWLPTAERTANSVRGDERRLDRPINESGGNLQTPAATSFTVPHPDPVLVTVTSPTVPRLPSVSVQQPGEFPRHSTAYYVIPYVSHPLDTNNQQGIAAPCVASDLNQISSTAYIGATLQTSEE